jgi:hypothetical protein
MACQWLNALAKAVPSWLAASTHNVICIVANYPFAPADAAAAAAAGEDPDYSADRVRVSIKASMQRLGVDYIDILHCHDIEFCPDMRQVSSTAVVAHVSACTYDFDCRNHACYACPGITVGDCISTSCERVGTSACTAGCVAAVAVALSLCGP